VSILLLTLASAKGHLKALFLRDPVGIPGSFSFFKVPSTREDFDVWRLCLPDFPSLAFFLVEKEALLDALVPRKGGLGTLHGPPPSSAYDLFPETYAAPYDRRVLPVPLLSWI